MLDHEHPERTQRNQYRYLLNGTSMSGIMLTWGKWVPTYSTQIDVFRLMEVPFRYLFTAKHHGGDKTAAQWHPGLSDDDEFAVFDGADHRELSDEDGNLYGALSDGEESLRF